MTHLLTWLPSWIFLIKASQLCLCSRWVVLWCQDDLPNTFAWVVSIHPYIHPVNGNGDHFLLVCQTTHKWTNISQQGWLWYSITYKVLYSHPQHHNDARKKTQEDFFRKIFTSLFIARVRKGCSRFACERVLETEHKLHVLTPLLWPSHCVFLVLLLFNQRPRAHSIGGFREPPRSDVAFPTTSGL